MDFLDIIITIAILSVGGLLTGRKGKKAARRQSTSAGPRPAFAPEPEPEYDFVQDDDESEIFVAEEQERGEASEKGSFGWSYFTYEDEQPASQSDGAPVREAAEAETPFAAFDEPEQCLSLLGEPFDLRKAFIYQTVLERVEC